MRVESIVEDKANPDAQHGTTFTVFIRKLCLLRFMLLCPTIASALGSDHLSRQQVDESDSNYRRTNSYGIGIVEEATGWAKSKLNPDDATPSETTNSDSAADSGSSRSGDMAALFRFAPEDVILVVDDSEF